MVRSTDLIIFLIDPTQNDQLNLLYSEFEKAQIKLNAQRPKVYIKRQGIGGIEFLGAKYFQFNHREAVQMLVSHGYHNAVITAFEPITLEDLADVLNESIVYLPLIIVKTKSDLKQGDISSKEKKGIDELKERIFHALSLIKVYTKTPGKPKDFPPVALHDGDNIESLARIIHKDFIKKFNYARVWGKSTKHEGQKFGLEHELKDEDVVEFHIK
jgi:ribosome-interacting GTPase 1